jgi:hypothetical protein
MAGRRTIPTLVDMKRKLLLILIVSGLILLALAGWTVQGLRWAFGGESGTAAPVPA